MAAQIDVETGLGRGELDVERLSRRRREARRARAPSRGASFSAGSAIGQKAISTSSWLRAAM